MDAKVVPLGARDVIPDERTIYELQLTYNFNVSKSTDITPNLALLSDVLYESEFESQLWMLYNSQKQLVACGDAYPSRWSVKVVKDDYVLKAHVRHEKKDVLDKIMDLPLSLGVKLASSVTLDYYLSFQQASTGGKKSNSFVLHPNKAQSLFVTAASCNDKHAKGAVIGQHLEGTVSLSKDELGKKADTFPVKFMLCEPSKRDKNSNKKKDTTLTASYQESLFEHKANWLAKMDPVTEESKDLYQELLATPGLTSDVKVIQVHVARLQSMEIDKKGTEAKAQDAIDVAEKVLARIDAKDVLAFFATKFNDESAKKDMEKLKGWYVETSAKKGIGHCLLGQLESANQCLLDCLQFVEQTDSKIVTFATIHAEKIGHYGRAVKLIHHQLESKPNSPDLDAKLVELYEKLEWDHIAKLCKLSKPIRFPKDYELF